MPPWISINLLEIVLGPGMMNLSVAGNVRAVRSSALFFDWTNMFILFILPV